MDAARARIVVASAVEGLAGPEKAILRYHQAVGTGMICGSGKAMVWYEDGCGCLAVLATMKEVPEERLADDLPWEGGNPSVPSWTRTVFRQLNRSAGGDLLAAMAVLTPEQVWAAAGEGLG